MNRMGIVRAATIVLIVAITAYIYWPVQGFDFVNYDDEAYVTANRHVKAGLTREGIYWAFTDKGVGHWHPLTWISHMIDVELFSLHPGGHHWTNVLIHFANASILTLALTSLTGTFWRSLAVAALFAVHPLNCESVAWIAERKNVLSIFFFLLALWSYGKYVKTGLRWSYYAMIFIFLCGIMTKPIVVTFPFVLLLLDYWPLSRLASGSQASGAEGKRARLSSLFVEKIPLLAIIPFSIIMTIQAARYVDTVASLSKVPLSDRLYNAAISYVSYLGKAVWPRNLAVFYPYPSSFTPLEVGGAFLFILVISSVVFFLAKRRPYLAVGWFWYLGTLVPVIGIVQAGGQAMADRYAYLSLIGIFIAVVWLMADLVKETRVSRKIAISALAVVVLALTLASRQQVLIWRNSISLFSHALSTTIGNHVAHSNLGKAFVDAGRLQEAAFHYEQALKISPSAEGHNNLGMVLAELGRVNEAMIHYQAALAQKPTYAEAYNNIGVIAGRGGDLSRAISLFAKAISLKGDYADAHNNLGYALAVQGRHEEAIPSLQAALYFDPDHQRARRNLVVSLLAQQRWEEALRHLEILLLRASADGYLQTLFTEAEAGRRIKENKK